ncbi:hypothetical protein GPALN_004889 [Globodera pallida]|nr:hypothetical protein GPALN_004889 [Globodera pallida]
MFRETAPRFFFNSRPLVGVYPPLITRASTPMPTPPGPMPFPPMAFPFPPPPPSVPYLLAPPQGLFQTPPPQLGQHRLPPQHFPTPPQQFIPHLFPPPHFSVPPPPFALAPQLLPPRQVQFQIQPQPPGQFFPPTARHMAAPPQPFCPLPTVAHTPMHGHPLTNSFHLPQTANVQPFRFEMSSNQPQSDYQGNRKSVFRPKRRSSRRRYGRSRERRNDARRSMPCEDAKCSKKREGQRKAVTAKKESRPEDPRLAVFDRRSEARENAKCQKNSEGQKKVVTVKKESSSDVLKTEPVFDRRSEARENAKCQKNSEGQKKVVTVKNESSSDVLKTEPVFVRASEPPQDAKNAKPTTMNNDKGRKSPGKQAAFRLLDPRFRSSAPIYAHLRLRPSGPIELTNGQEANDENSPPLMPPGLE